MVHKCQAVNAWCFCFFFFPHPLTHGYHNWLSMSEFWPHTACQIWGIGPWLSNKSLLIPCLQTLTGKSGGYKLAFITRAQAADNLEVTMGKLYTSPATLGEFSRWPPFCWELGRSTAGWEPIHGRAKFSLKRVATKRKANGRDPPKISGKFWCPNIYVVEIWLEINGILTNHDPKWWCHGRFPKQARFKSFEWYSSTDGCARSRIGNTGRHGNTVGTRQFLIV